MPEVYTFQLLLSFIARSSESEAVLWALTPVAGRKDKIANEINGNHTDFRGIIYTF